MIDAWIEWMEATRLSAAMLDSGWTWPLAEAVHFAGLVLLAGTVGLFDLRVLGLGRGIPPTAIHRLVPIGVLGFVLLAATGVLFVFGTPDQYLYNAAFRWKVALLGLMGANAAFFYAVPYRALARLGADGDAPRDAKICAALSLALLVAVMFSGRMLTFFRPVDGGF